MENSVDPDKMASEKKPADQDLVFSKMESTGQGLILGSAGQEEILIIPAFFFRKKGYINFVSKSVRRPSVCPSVRLSVRLSVRAYVRPSRFL